MDLPGRKARGILAYLALAPDNAATREQLSGLLWTDRGAEQARASLRQSLKELRELALAPATISTSRDGVRLDGQYLVTDIGEIGHAARTNDLGALASALDTLRGDLLEDFLDVSPAFDEWLLAERPRQRDSVLLLALGAVEASGLSDMMHTASILRSLDRIDPVNEAVVRLGMRMDHACGDAASLHRRYRLLCDRLEAEFDAIPSEETRSLFYGLSARREAAPPEPTPVPAPTGSHSRNRVGDMVPLVLVAPLQSHGTDTSLSSLADFCSDDIRAAISRLRGVQVLTVDGGSIDAVIDAGSDALALFLLSGSIRQVGDEIRVTLQLANAQDKVIVWSESLRFGEAGGAMLDTIVAKAAGAVIPAVDRDLEARLRQSASELDGDRAKYTRARLLIRTSGHLGDVREGVQLLESLLEHDPQHFGARLTLARMYNTDFWQQVCGHDWRRFRELSELHLQAAAAIEPANCETRVRQAWHLLRKGEVDAARRNFDRVERDLPHDAELYNMVAMGRCLLGEIDAAQSLMQQAFFLNPLPPSDYHADYAIMLVIKKEHETAEDHFAVSGEGGMQYAAVRIANSAELDAGEQRLGPAAPKFISDFHGAWQQQRKPQVADVLEWIGYTLPFHPPRHLDWVRTRLRQKLEPLWPA